jgi:NAD(P)-dependent dehydrogenase (short-subunit alcohol dehydrogenase family)
MTDIVLITGASQGSGKATALLFARHGYDVILAARQPEPLEQVAAAVRAENRQALAVPTDTSDAQQVEMLIQKALDRFGRVDVLVNNAGFYLSGLMKDTPLADWHRLMGTNFWGYVHTIQGLLPQFLARGNGSIVNVGSVGGVMPLPEMTAFCASKYAVAGMTDTLRLELAPKGIQVCAVHPGAVDSNFLERAIFRGLDATQVEERRTQIQAILPANWVSQPQDVAEAVWSAVQSGKAEMIVGQQMTAIEALQVAAVFDLPAHKLLTYFSLPQPPVILNQQLEVKHVY